MSDDKAVYLFTDIQCDTPISCITTQQNTTFWGVVTREGIMTPQIETWARFLYNAPSCQVSSFYV